jgi:hypothetical protein
MHNIEDFIIFISSLIWSMKQIIVFIKIARHNKLPFSVFLRRIVRTGKAKFQPLGLKRADIVKLCAGTLCISASES